MALIGLLACNFRKMKYSILILVLICGDLFGQTATVVDSDGYSNVRLSPNDTSEIIYKVPTDEIFILGEDYYQEKDTWATVYITKNKFSLGCDDIGYIKGYIHKSRILPIEQMQLYLGNDFKFKYETKPFDSTGKIYDYYKESEIITLINGRHAWGTDGGIPKIETQNIKIEIKGIKINVPKTLISDIYECNNSFRVYKKDNTYFVDQWNSDGAGAYNLVWVISEAEIIQRFIFTP